MSLCLQRQLVWTSDTASYSVVVNIVGDIPKIKFSIKSQAVTGLPGDQKTVVAMQIANKRCVKKRHEDCYNLLSILA